MAIGFDIDLLGELLKEVEKPLAASGGKIEVDFNLLARTLNSYRISLLNSKPCSAIAKIKPFNVLGKTEVLPQ